MKTFMDVNRALLPFAIFSLLFARGMPVAAICAGLVASAAISAWWTYRHDINALELAVLAIFGLLTLGVLLFPDAVADSALTLALIGLGVFAAASVLVRRPWTAEFSRAEYVNEASDPLFIAVNIIVSGAWGALFLLLAAASALKAGLAVTLAIVMFGADISMVGPKVLIRKALARRFAARKTYHWPAPALGGALAAANSMSRW